MNTLRLGSSFLAIAALALARPTAAQQILFEDGFEDGSLDRWTTTGMWHLSSQDELCTQAASPYPSPAHCARFGDPQQCFFDLFGQLTLAEPVLVPEWAASARLVFESYESAECASCKWDWRFVYVSDDGGATWAKVGEGTQLDAWYTIEIDLSAYVGREILVRFEFDAVDGYGNFYLGWFVDDVRIVASCVEPTNYCVAAPNSFGPGATIAGRGSTSIAENYFKVTAEGAPPGQFGLFYYGSQAIQLPFGDGWRCVGAGTSGTFRLNPPVQIDATGFVYHLLDFTAPPLNSGAGKIEPGVTWYFQLWYRDPAFGGTGYNLSDGLAAIFCP